jgi:hypothetical protein
VSRYPVPVAPASSLHDETPGPSALSAQEKDVGTTDPTKYQLPDEGAVIEALGGGGTTHVDTDVP